MAITTITDERLPFYRRYADQDEPQKAWITIDPENRSIYAETSRLGGGESLEVRHNRKQRIIVDPTVSFFSWEWFQYEKEVIGLLNTLYNEYDCHWNGDHLIGQYSKIAQEALDQLNSLAEKTLETAEVLEAGAWFDPNISFIGSKLQKSKMWSCSPIIAQVSVFTITPLSRPSRVIAQLKSLDTDGVIILGIETWVTELINILSYNMAKMNT